MAARADGWSWDAPSGEAPKRSVSSRKIPILAVTLLAVASYSVSGAAGSVVAQTPTPERRVEVLPPEQLPAMLDEDGLVIVDQFGTGVKPDEPYRAPPARPPIPGPAATYDVVLYNSRLILLETPSGGTWSRSVTYKRV